MPTVRPVPCSSRRDLAVYSCRSSSPRIRNDPRPFASPLPGKRRLPVLPGRSRRLSPGAQRWNCRFPAAPTGWSRPAFVTVPTPGPPFIIMRSFVGAVRPTRLISCSGGSALPTRLAPFSGGSAFLGSNAAAPARLPAAVRCTSAYISSPSVTSISAPASFLTQKTLPRCL